MTNRSQVSHFHLVFARCGVGVNVCWKEGKYDAQAGRDVDFVTLIASHRWRTKISEIYPFRTGNEIKFGDSSRARDDRWSSAGAFRTNAQTSSERKRRETASTITLAFLLGTHRGGRTTLV